MRRIILTSLCLGLAGCMGAQSEITPRPDPQADARPMVEVARTGNFSDWMTAFEQRAQAAGIEPRTLARVRPHVTYLPGTITLDRQQSEFGARVWDYMDSAVTAGRISQGQAEMRRHGPLLAQIEQRFGVPPEIVVAIWGIESSFGAARGRVSTLSTLATLAKDGRRGAFFEGQLLDALRIVQAGDIAPQAMIGSWAGAFGHTQFMPSSFLAYAVDITGDGRRDVWGPDPSDALVSRCR